MINKLRFYQEIDMYDHQSHFGFKHVGDCLCFVYKLHLSFCSFKMIFNFNLCLTDHI